MLALLVLAAGPASDGGMRSILLGLVVLAIILLFAGVGIAIFTFYTARKGRVSSE